jgi:hypothetical protein
MRSIFTKSIMLVFAVLFSALPAKAKTTYPEGLKFLESNRVPEIMSIGGLIVALDSTDKVMLQMPFHFYWEKERYIFDIRLPGGGPAGVFRGDADSVWIYDFFRKVKLVTLLDQKTGWANSMPFTAKDILMVFNLFPVPPGDIDTFYTEASTTVIKTKSGTKYVFDKATGRLILIQTENSQMHFYDYTQGKKKTLPSRVELNAGLMVPGSAKMIIKIRNTDYKKEVTGELIDQILQIRMPHEFDLRSQALESH